MLDTPTTAEWCRTAVAALLVAAVAGLHVVRPALRHGTTARSARVAGWLLATIAVGLVLVVVVMLGAGIRASMISLEDLQSGTHLPSGPFTRYLFDRNLDTTERVPAYAAAVLLPLAATFVVLALAVVDQVRSVGLRAVAAIVCGLLVAVTGFVATGDVGPLATRTAVGLAVAAVAAVLALAIDELGGRKPATGR